MRIIDKTATLIRSSICIKHKGLISRVDQYFMPAVHTHHAIIVAVTVAALLTYKKGPLLPILFFLFLSFFARSVSAPMAGHCGSFSALQQQQEYMVVSRLSSSSSAVLGLFWLLLINFSLFFFLQQFTFAVGR